MDPTRPSAQELLIRTTAAELRAGSFTMPDVEITEPLVEIVFEVQVDGEALRGRTRLSAEFIASVPEWKSYAGKQVLGSLTSYLASNA